jgi:hypothetical protein
LIHSPPMYMKRWSAFLSLVMALTLSHCPSSG